MPCMGRPALPPLPPSVSPHLNLSGLVFNFINKKFLLLFLFFCCGFFFSDEVFYIYRLVGPTRALQVSHPPNFYFQLSFFHSFSLSRPHVFGNPVILLIWQRCLQRRKILNIVWGQALLLYRLRWSDQWVVLNHFCKNKTPNYFSSLRYSWILKCIVYIVDRGMITWSNFTWHFQLIESFC